MPADTWDFAPVTPEERAALSGHRGAVVWFTGLSGAGKTTVARALDRRLFEAGRRTFLLDGDVVRTGLNTDLGFSAEDRTENLRRFTEVARLFADAGMIALVSVISPYAASRAIARERIGTDRFVLVHMAAPLQVCEARDPKGLYRRARAGEIPQFTGIDSPYEEPEAPDLRFGPEDGNPNALTGRVLELLQQRGIV